MSLDVCEECKTYPRSDILYEFSEMFKDVWKTVGIFECQEAVDCGRESRSKTSRRQITQ